MGATPARRAGWKAAAEATTAVKTAALVYMVVSAMEDLVCLAET